MAARHRRRGAAGQQYAIIVGLIGVVALAAISSSGTVVKSLFGTVGNRLTDATNGTSGPSEPPALQYARARLSGSGTSGTKDVVFVVMPSGTTLTTSAQYKAACESRGFSQNQNSNPSSSVYANSGMYDTTNYYCNRHCCFLGSGNSVANHITGFQNFGIPLNTTYPVLDRGCGERNVSFTHGINTSDALTVTGPTSYSYGANQLGAYDYSTTTKLTAINPTAVQTIMICQMP